MIRKIVGRKRLGRLVFEDVGVLKPGLYETSDSRRQFWCVYADGAILRVTRRDVINMLKEK